MNKLDLDYQNLLKDILDNGVTKQDRTGTGTLSVFGRQIRHKMSDGFPLLTTKKMPFKTITTELLWFLRGDTNIKYLVDNGCNIWNGDCYSNYIKNWKPENKNVGGDYFDQKLEDERPLPKDVFIHLIKTNDKFAKEWGELGPIYGRQWRRWEGYTHGMVLGAGLSKEQPIDQIANLINELKTNPDSRRLMVNAWNVGELDSMALPPCHYGFQVYTRELSTTERMEYYGKHFMKETESKTFDELLKVNYDELNIPTRAISLMFNMRSNDVPLGLPFNLASYGLLLEIIAKEVNMVPDELFASLGDAHIYVNQIDGVKEQLTREPYQLPKLVINDEFWNHDANLIEQINHIEITDFEISDYQSHPTIKIPLSN